MLDIRDKQTMGPLCCGLHPHTWPADTIDQPVICIAIIRVDRVHSQLDGATVESDETGA